MNKKLFAMPLLLVLAAGLLPGCSKQTDTKTWDGEGTPVSATATPPNQDACAEFEIANNKLADLLSNGKGSLTVEQWKTAHQNQVEIMDSISLRATSPVAERIESVVALVPIQPIDMVTAQWRVGEAYNYEIGRVARACEAEGFPQMLHDLILPPEILRR